MNHSPSSDVWTWVWEVVVDHSKKMDQGYHLSSDFMVLKSTKGPSDFDRAFLSELEAFKECGPTEDVG